MAPYSDGGSHRSMGNEGGREGRIARHHCPPSSIGGIADAMAHGDCHTKEPEKSQRDNLSEEGSP